MVRIPDSPLHGSGAVSAWVARWRHLLQPGMHALDLACGAGRHTRWLLDAGLAVCAVDRDPAAIAALHELARTHPAGPDRLDVFAADLEGGPWPLAGRRFDLVLVTNYLWRPRLPELLDCVAPDGWLIYETFALGHEQYGRPRNPDFLLRPGELLTLLPPDWHVLACEDGLLDAPLRRVQRITARRLGSAAPGSVQLHS